MSNYIIIHGTEGYPEETWIPYLKQNLEKEGHTVYVPQLPSPEGQSKEAWCATLREKTPTFGKDTVLIGHSCGATCILHILESVKEPVKKAICVSPLIHKIGIEKYDKLNETFINHSFDWNKIKNNAKEGLILHGDNDLYVPLSHPKEVSENTNFPLTLIQNGGHLNATAGFTEFPKLLKLAL